MSRLKCIVGTGSDYRGSNTTPLKNENINFEFCLRGDFASRNDTMVVGASVKDSLRRQCKKSAYCEFPRNRVPFILQKLMDEKNIMQI